MEINGLWLCDFLTLRTSVPLFYLNLTSLKSLQTFIPLFASNHLEKDQFVTNKVSYVRNDSRNALKVQNKGTDVRKHRPLNIAAVLLFIIWPRWAVERVDSSGRKGERDPAGT
ncbi:hypothetical protein [Pontibacillus sp. HMF3514]|uniref:hypothetical protein n=1 Tax=Pontibacillus sp. HMF3514 TaxID=2692425 RepID=UPI00131F90E4|nr:hypothetical protein [Pontibacillus sp. HMF3514]QHE52321.1 hypothetical protein GS400_09860 [Pontibacillus sp. HMF3514]